MTDYYRLYQLGARPVIRRARGRGILPSANSTLRYAQLLLLKGAQYWVYPTGDAHFISRWGLLSLLD